MVGSEFNPWRIMNDAMAGNGIPIHMDALTQGVQFRASMTGRRQVDVVLRVVLDLVERDLVRRVERNASHLAAPSFQHEPKYATMCRRWPTRKKPLSGTWCAGGSLMIPRRFA